MHLFLTEPERVITDSEWLANLPDLTTVTHDELEAIGYGLQEMVRDRGSWYHIVAEVDPMSYDRLTPAELYRAIEWLRADENQQPKPDQRMRRTFDIESSQFSPGASWDIGLEMYMEPCTVEYSVGYDFLHDDDLREMADDGRDGVIYIVEEKVAP